MDDDLTTTGPTTGASWPRPPVAMELEEALPPLTREHLLELLQGDHESDATECVAAFTARGRGALDLAIGDGLAAMRVGDRLISLGFSGVGDYGREVLGIGDRTAQSMARLSLELSKRPQLRAAVRSGEVRIRKAQVILPVAIGDAEAEWVQLAKEQTVRTLEALVREARADPAEDERWGRLRVRLTAEERATVDEGLDVAGRVLGPASTRRQRLEAWAQEYLSGHPVEAEDRMAPSIQELGKRREVREEREAELELDTQYWMLLHKVPDLCVPDVRFDELTSATEIDAELRRLVEVRATWDDILGHTALAIKASGVSRYFGFLDFRHYCSERLGLAPRTVEERAALERRLWQLPALREAYTQRRLSYEQARLLSRLPDAEIPGWIPRAEAMTCIELRRALERREETQLRAVGTFASDLPREVALTLSDALRAAGAVLGPQAGDGQRLAAIARHFIDVWEPLVSWRKTMSQRVRERDGGFCQVPMCSRPAGHAHHIRFLSHGGPDTMENQVADCPCHHLRGIHGGYIQVSRADDGKLVWVIAGKVWRGPERRPPRGVVVASMSSAESAESSGDDPSVAGTEAGDREGHDPSSET